MQLESMGVRSVDAQSKAALHKMMLRWEVWKTMQEMLNDIVIYACIIKDGYGEDARKHQV